MKEKGKPYVSLPLMFSLYNTPCTIRVFTDECMDWIIEDNSFTRELAGFDQPVREKGL